VLPEQRKRFDLAKSFGARILRGLIDPNAAALRTVPRDESELFIAARSAHVIALDNLSGHGFKDWLSDALCRLCSGGGLSKKELYSDCNEFVLPDTRRPILATSIDMFIGRQDLLDRSFVVSLPTITAARREREETILDRFHQAHPKLLGALLDGASCALAAEPTADPPALPRLADTAKWISGAELALGEPGAFLRTYRDAHREIVENGLESTRLYPTLKRWFSAQPGRTWTGTSGELLAALEAMPNPGRLPSDATRMASALNRMDAALRTVGILVIRHPRERDKRLITICFSDD
jgi:hypothetical protein